MSVITATLNGVQMPPIEQDFINTPLENATDVQVLSGDIYTDFISQGSQWTFNYDSLTETQYNALRAAYDAQFTSHVYPTLAIPYYSVSSKARMTINDKNIWNNCGSVQNVTITFRLTS